MSIRYLGAFSLFVSLCLTSAGQTTQATSTLPKEVSEATAKVQALASTIARCRYTASFTFETENYLKALTPDGSKFLNTPLVPPVTSSGQLQLQRNQDVQLVQVTPVESAPFHKNRSFSAQSVYQSDGKIVKIYSDADKTLRIDTVGGNQHIQARPRDLFLLSDLFDYHLTSDWPRIYANLDEQNAKEAIARYGIARTISHEKRADGAHVVVTESLRIQHLITSFGPLTVDRVVDYAENVNWLPVRVVRREHGENVISVDLAWDRIANNQQVLWMPVFFTWTRYFPSESKPGAKSVVLNIQTLKLDKTSIAFGNAVGEIPLDKLFPKDARIYKTSASAKTSVQEIEPTVVAQQVATVHSRSLFGASAAILAIFSFAALIRRRHAS